jgi:uncharacterized protein (TIGR00369 family)
MKRLNPEYVERINKIVNNSPFFKLISMQIRDIGAGYSVIEIDLAQKHLQPFGYVHGGVFASIIDAAAFWALYYDIDEKDAGATTVDLKLNYLEPAQSGKLIAKGRRIRMGKTLGYAEVEVSDENEKILAHGTSTVIILPGKALSAESELPLKFIE